MKLPWIKKVIKIPIMSRSEKRYFEGLKDAQGSKDIKKKITAYENNLKSLEDFISEWLARDGELPPIIPCRDELPELYKQIGDWKNAERVIKHCIACNAYFPENGETELKDLLLYQIAAEKALELIKENPGVLQKNIYKMLKDENLDDYSLKHFTRCSLQIKKVPANGTNRLYAK